MELEFNEVTTVSKPQLIGLKPEHSKLQRSLELKHFRGKQPA